MIAKCLVTVVFVVSAPQWGLYIFSAAQVCTVCLTTYTTSIVFVCNTFQFVISVMCVFHLTVRLCRVFAPLLCVILHPFPWLRGSRQEIVPCSSHNRSSAIQGGSRGVTTFTTQGLLQTFSFSVTTMLYICFCFQPLLNWKLTTLTWSFFKQSFLKQILTEGKCPSCSITQFQQQ